MLRELQVTRVAPHKRNDIQKSPLCLTDASVDERCDPKKNREGGQIRRRLLRCAVTVNGRQETDDYLYTPFSFSILCILLRDRVDKPPGLKKREILINALYTRLNLAFPVLSLSLSNERCSYFPNELHGSPRKLREDHRS